MKGIKCNGCGLINTAYDAVCRRCKQDLSSSDPISPAYIDPKSPRPVGNSNFPVVALGIVAVFAIGLGLLFYRSFSAAAEQPKALIPSILPTPTPDEQEIKAQKAEQDAMNKLKSATPNPVVDTQTPLRDQERKAIQPAYEEVQREIKKGPHVWVKQ